MLEKSTDGGLPYAANIYAENRGLTALALRLGTSTVEACRG